MSGKKDSLILSQETGLLILGGKQCRLVLSGENDPLILSLSKDYPELVQGSA